MEQLTNKKFRRSSRTTTKRNMRTGGRTIGLPSSPKSADKELPGNLITRVTSREEFDVCCFHPSDISTDDWSGMNYVYPHADWCYVGVGVSNYLFVVGTIYIDGVPSTNPLYCDGEEGDCTECYGCDPASYPNYSLYSWGEPTGNADAIAAMWRGTIVGFEFVNTMMVAGNPAPGISLGMAWQWPSFTDIGLDPLCYPPIGDKIDNLLLYKASTGEYYQLTAESYNIFINAIEPIGQVGGSSLISEDLYFEPYGTEQEPLTCSCHDGTQDCEPSLMNPGYWSSCSDCLMNMCGNSSYCDDVPDDWPVDCYYCDNCVWTASSNTEFPECPFEGHAYGVGSGWAYGAYVGPLNQLCVPARWVESPGILTTSFPNYNPWFWKLENVTLPGGQQLSPDDWVGAFCNNILVGTRRWDPNLCNIACDVPAFGVLESEPGTKDYCKPFDNVRFKIWQASTDTYYTAMPSHAMRFGWQEQWFYPADAYGYSPNNYSGVPMEEFFLSAVGIDDGSSDDDVIPIGSSTINYSLHEGSNLISIPLELQDSSLEAVFGTDTTIMDSIQGQGVASQLLENGEWVGSIDYIDPLQGYWVDVKQAITLSISGRLINPTYQLATGNNLISFSGIVPVSPTEALLGFETIIEQVITEADALSNVNGEWVGSINEFEVGKGYWVEVNQDVDFQWGSSEPFDISNLSTPNKKFRRRDYPSI